MAPNSSLRAQVTPAEQQVAMSWAQRLKRVLRIDIATCEHCGGAVKAIASIEAPVLIKQILEPLARRAHEGLTASHAARAPPQGASPRQTK